jgi:cell division protein FtsL
MYKLDDGTDISRMTAAQIAEAMQRANHERKMALMRELGKVNRMETRIYMLWAVAAVLIVLALVGMAS